MSVTSHGGYLADNDVPVSFKAVVRDAAGHVLLAKNSRQEWELPGGRPDTTDASPSHTVEREVLEETGILVQARHIVDSWLYPVLGHRRVAIVTYLCDPIQNPALQISAEHSELRFFSPNVISSLAIPDGYRTSIHKALLFRAWRG